MVGTWNSYGAWIMYRPTKDQILFFVLGHSFRENFFWIYGSVLGKKNEWNFFSKFNHERYQKKKIWTFMHTYLVMLHAKFHWPGLKIDRGVGIWMLKTIVLRYGHLKFCNCVISYLHMIYVDIWLIFFSFMYYESIFIVFGLNGQAIISSIWS